MTPPTPLVRRLGLRPYQTVWQAMRRFTDQRNEQTADEWWLVEHPPVYTLGRAGDRRHLLDRGQTPLVESDRGGQITYHAPGQLVLYPLLDLRRLGGGVRWLVEALQGAVIDLLAAASIEAWGREDAPGVYCKAGKIASLGLRIRRHCSYHGVALNVDIDLAPFEGINPCGMAGLRMARTCDLGGPRSVDEAIGALLPTLAARLGVHDWRETASQGVADGAG